MATNRYDDRRQLDLLPPAPSTPFVVRESKRARRMTIKVVPNRGVEVVVPPHVGPRRVEAFVSANREWIAAAREALATDCAQADCSLPDRIELPAIGRRWQVVYRPEGRASVSQRGDILYVPASVSDEDRCRSLLRAWLASVAKKQLVPALHELAQACRLSATRVQVRGQKTRWGSCSSSGTISINFCLLFLPPDWVQYLFLHELCHTRHLDHSSRFWQLVSEFEPDFRRLENHLNTAWQDVPGWVGLH